MPRFMPPGPLALMPAAYGQEVVPMAAQQLAPAQYSEHACVVPIRGPLMHHLELSDPVVPGGQFKMLDNYDSIKDRARFALESPAATIVLAIDSAGGHVAGCFDTVSEIAAMARVAGKRVVAFVDGVACSAAYALACAGEKIYAAEGTLVGSIGIIDTVIDQSAADEKMGVSWNFLTTGSRKADGNPHVALSSETVKARKAIIDSMAEPFFELVASARGLSVDDVKAFEAATFTARQAKANGLIDEIMTLDQLLTMLASSSENDAPAGQKEAKMADIKDAVAALRKAAEGDDEDAKQAKKMLAALDEEEEAKAEGDDGEKKEEAKAEGESDDEAKAEGDEEKKEEAKAMTASQIAALVDSRLQAVRTAEAESSERAALLASRKDLSAEAHKALAALPVAQLRAILPTIPRGNVSPIEASRMALGVTGTQGSAAATGAATTTRVSAHADELDRRMGITSAVGGVRNEDNKLILSAVRPRGAK